MQGILVSEDEDEGDDARYSCTGFLAALFSCRPGMGKWALGAQSPVQHGIEMVKDVG